ncbi:MAG: class I SAM-dependent RNA methyltransferase [Microcystis sp.]|jgi:putative N6-adenine-specific DNA methylase|uniref:Putative enzyme n=1 Tax=Microcystis aeruginosa PCC 9701 TaxID=721123 RepID=I4IU71_MICAE|nr:THUMP domain-containing protein [Microcystis aeruginosa]CCI37845.1 putative enzyme [Microcystis aeruginosa PCC 9701]
MTRSYFATTARGLEEIAARELECLGAKEVKPVFTGVHFQGDISLLYRVNLWSRIIFRVLVPIAEIPCGDGKELYDGIQAIDWRDYLTSEETLAVQCTGTNDRLNHTHYTALSIKNAIIDQQRQQGNPRSFVDTENPDLQINAHIEKNRCVLSLDSSGHSLHRRGYHRAMGVAPLKESLAAALVELSAWQDDMALLDPFCGSGTIVIEATLKALNIAPGLSRSQFGFQKWPDYQPDLWQSLLQEAKEKQKSQLNAPIYASDADYEVLHQAEDNAYFCQVQDHINFSLQSITDLEPTSDRGIILCNPPYGKRLGNTEELGTLYKSFGDVLKQRFKGWTAYILSGNKELTKQIGLRSSRRTPLYNGSLPCTLLKYELY